MFKKILLFIYYYRIGKSVKNPLSLPFIPFPTKEAYQLIDRDSNAEIYDRIVKAEHSIENILFLCNQDDPDVDEIRKEAEKYILP